MAAKRLYAWERWFQRKRFQLNRGTDYDCSQLTMAQQIRNAATRYANGLKVHVEEGLDGESLIVVTKPRS